MSGGTWKEDSTQTGKKPLRWRTNVSIHICYWTQNSKISRQIMGLSRIYITANNPPAKIELGSYVIDFNNFVHTNKYAGEVRISMLIEIYFSVAKWVRMHTPLRRTIFNISCPMQKFHIVSQILLMSAWLYRVILAYRLPNYS